MAFTHTPTWAPPAAATAAATAVAAAAGWAATARRLRVRTHELRQAQRDQVTGLLNRKGWEQAACGLLGTARSSTVGLADLDEFKPINDTHGHEAGDHVLRIIAARLATSLGPAAITGRFGGDEFVFVTRGTVNAAMLDDLISVLSQPIRVTGDGELTVGVSLGVTFPRYLPDVAVLPEALAAADSAMYEAKTSRSGWRTHEPSPYLACPRTSDQRARGRGYAHARRHPAIAG